MSKTLPKTTFLINFMGAPMTSQTSDGIFEELAIRGLINKILSQERNICRWRDGMEDIFESDFSNISEFMREGGIIS